MISRRAFTLGGFLTALLPSRRYYGEYPPPEIQKPEVLPFPLPMAELGPCLLTCQYVIPGRVDRDMSRYGRESWFPDAHEDTYETRVVPLTATGEMVYVAWSEDSDPCGETVIDGSERMRMLVEAHQPCVGVTILE